MSVSPPRPAGPHLNALRAFEAAARLGGFKAAAAELCVTPGAVSQQVKALEDWAGSPLFQRQAQGVQLTDLGRSVIADFTAAFDLLDRAQRQLRTGAAGSEIRIAALPAVAQLWLAPRMPGIRRQLPGVTLSVSALETPPNLAREMYDLSLFIRDPAAVPDGIQLAEDRIFPVCNPAIAKDITTPEMLGHQTLLRDAVWSDDWERWLAARPEQPTAAPRPGPAYSLYALAVTEALAGAGLLIGHECLIDHHLQAGTLVAPFADRVGTGRALMLEIASPAHPSVPALVDLWR